MEPFQAHTPISKDSDNHNTSQAEKESDSEVANKGQKTISQVTEERDAPNDDRKACVAANSLHIGEEPVNNTDFSKNMVYRFFSSEKVTRAVENLFFYSNELTLHDDIRDIINRSKTIVLENPGLHPRMYNSIAMQAFRVNVNTQLCPLCHKRKEDRVNNKKESQHPNCHFFPRSLLEEFRNKYCEIYLKDFIFNEVSGEYKGANTLTRQMFCQMCESSASRDEELLCHYYLRLNGMQENTVHMPREHALKVKHILAVIFFRCMLLGVDILDGYEDLFWNAFNSLREFCCMTNVEDYKDHPLLSKFHVFILDNKAYSKEHSSFSHIIDFQLRNPQLTRMVKIDENNVFLYMKFDSFHCILLLKWSNDILRFDLENYFHNFPEFLWAHNLAQVGSLWQCLLQLKKKCQVFIQDPLVRIASSKLHQSLPLPPSVKVIVTTNEDPVSMLSSDEKKYLRSSARHKFFYATLDKQIRGDYLLLEEKYVELERKFKEFQSSCDAKTNEKLQKLRDKCKRSFENQRANMDRKFNAACKKLEGRINRLENTSNYLKQRIGDEKN